MCSYAGSFSSIDISLWNSCLHIPLSLVTFDNPHCTLSAVFIRTIFLVENSFNEKCLQRGLRSKHCFWKDTFLCVCVGYQFLSTTKCCWGGGGAAPATRWICLGCSVYFITYVCLFLILFWWILLNTVGYYTRGSFSGTLLAHRVCSIVLYYVLGIQPVTS